MTFEAFTIYSDSSSGNTLIGSSEAWIRLTDAQGKNILRDYLFLFPDFTCEEKILPMGKEMVGIWSKVDQLKQQNNAGELQGLLMSLRIAIYRLQSEYAQEKVNEVKEVIVQVDHKRKPKEYSCDLLCDSQLVVNHWSLGNVEEKTRLTMHPKKIKYLEEVIELRQVLEQQYNGQVKWICGDDNLADLGFHKKKIKKNLSDGITGVAKPRWNPYTKKTKKPQHRHTPQCKSLSKP